MKHRFYSEEELTKALQSKIKSVQKRLEDLSRGERMIKKYIQRNNFLIKKSIELGTSHPEVIMLRKRFERFQNNLENLLTNEEYFYFNSLWDEMIQELPDKPGDYYEEEASPNPETAYNDPWDE